jgi:hypothetical protein
MALASKSQEYIAIVKKSKTASKGSGGGRIAYSRNVVKIISRV